MRLMKNDEIFNRIASDVAESYKFGRDISIWMSKGLFNKLYPETILINNTAMATLFGYNVKVIVYPSEELKWIVGHEGTVEN